MKSMIQFVLFWCVSLIPVTSMAESPIIAVASNLTSPVNEITEAFKKETGETVRLSFGSSGNLSRQIVQGAPYDIFISASKRYIDFLSENQVKINHHYEYIKGDIGFYIPSRSSAFEIDTPEGITKILKFGGNVRIAIANPQHAPYGIAALEALQSGGVWAISSKNLILAESVAQIVPYLQTGNLDLAIIPKSFVLQNALGQTGKFITIDRSWYRGISQYVAILNDANPVTFAYSDYLTSPAAISIMEKYGYSFTGNR